MKHWISLLIFSVIIAAFLGCAENDLTIPPLSTCIEQEIEAYKAASACGIDSARVTRYNSQIGYVYLFSYDYCCCDYASPILDKDCNEVCFLGGLAGISKCIYNSEELELVNPVVIWQK